MEYKEIRIRSLESLDPPELLKISRSLGGEAK
jgi:hypothetical protein